MLSRLLSKARELWWLPILILVSGAFLLSVHTSNGKDRELDMTRDSLFVARDSIKRGLGHLAAAQSVVDVLRLEKESEVAEKKRLFAEIIRLNNMRPPERDFKPVIVDVHDTLSVISGVSELSARVITLQNDNTHLRATLDATIVQVEHIQEVDRKASALLFTRIDSLTAELQNAKRANEAAAHAVDGAIKVSRRPWYKKTWSVAKETGKTLGIFFAGRASTKVVP